MVEICHVVQIFAVSSNIWTGSIFNLDFVDFPNGIYPDWTAPVDFDFIISCCSSLVTLE